MRRRLVIVGLVAGGLGLLAAFDTTLATGPALGLTAVAAWIVRA